MRSPGVTTCQPLLSKNRKYSAYDETCVRPQRVWGTCPVKSSVRFLKNSRIVLILAALSAALPACLHAQSADEIVRHVVKNELYADDHDHTRWMYRDQYQSPDKDIVKLIIQTPGFSLSEIILDHGRPPSEQEHQADLAHMQQLVSDPAAREKQKRNSQHDDQQARDLMNMLPEAFVWQVVSRENGEIRLSYKPNPNFSPPSMSARVMAAMSGSMVVDEQQMRLEQLNGRLMQAVEFGWGLFGKLNAGGTFQIVRSQLAPGIWDITQTHVHINGHALFFKSIGDQEDEVSSDYHRTPEGVDLVSAARMLRDGQVERDLHAELHTP